MAETTSTTTRRSTGSTTKRRAAGKKAASTRARSTAKSSAKRATTSAKTTTTASSKAAGNRLEAAALQAERGLLIGVGAALTARDNVVETVKPYTSRTTAEAELKKLQKKVTTDVTKNVKKFERRGTTERNRLEREVKRTRTRVERQLRQASNVAKRDAGKVQTSVSAAAVDVRNGNVQQAATKLQKTATTVAQDVQKQVTSLV
jgi:hypothetical protein